mmetsp:Transcript_25036/g.58345  ORF Transcript_25036/g.58345 Transcript_25036/m.58345 type:complete len:227 (-) Transcript_25036:569-1249(-)
MRVEPKRIAGHLGQHVAAAIHKQDSPSACATLRVSFAIEDDVELPFRNGRDFHDAPVKFATRQRLERNARLGDAREFDVHLAVLVATRRDLHRQHLPELLAFFAHVFLEPLALLIVHQLVLGQHVGAREHSRREQSRRHGWRCRGDAADGTAQRLQLRHGRKHRSRRWLRHGHTRHSHGCRRCAGGATPRIRHGHDAVDVDADGRLIVVRAGDAESGREQHEAVQT